MSAYWKEFGSADAFFILTGVSALQELVLKRMTQAGAAFLGLRVDDGVDFGLGRVYTYWVGRRVGLFVHVLLPRKSIVEVSLLSSRTTG